MTAAALRARVPALEDDGKFSDAVVGDLVAEFEEIAESYVGVAFDLRYAVESVHLSRDVEAIPLRHPHVRSVTSVVVDDTTLDSSGYELDAFAGAVVVALSKGALVTVTYAHGLGARTVTDGVTTDTDATVTSATAAFTVADIGETITGTGIADRATIASVTSATEIELSAVATATGTGITFTIGGPPTAVLRACREYVRSCALSDRSGVPRDVISQSAEGTYTRFSTPDWDAGRPTGWLEVDRLLNSLDNFQPSFA